MTGVDEDAHSAMVRAEAGKAHRFLDLRDPSVLAAEARCARLQQALREHGRHDERCASRHLDRSAGYTKRLPRFQDCDCGLDEALAGPDTPADSQPEENLAAQVQEAKRLLNEGDTAKVLAYLLDRDPDEIRAVLPADSQRLREYVCAHDHHWFMQADTEPKGCPVCNTITFKAADSQEDRT